MTEENEGPGAGMRIGALAMVCLALGWGTWLQVRPLLAFGVAALFVLGLLWRWPRVAAARLSVRRRMGAAALEDEELPVEFELINASRLPLLAPEVADRFTPDKLPHRRAVVWPLLPGRSAARASYRGRCFSRRGTFAIGPATVRLTCPVGLFATDVGPLEVAPLVVYPALESLPEVPPGGASRAALLGGAARREPGEGDVVHGVRDHRSGDPLRRVHWPTSARRGRLAILEMERHVSREVVLFLDLSPATLRGLGRQSTLEVAVRVVGSLAARLLEQGARVGLVADGKEPIRIGPGRGPLQLVRILEVLARVRPDGALSLPALLDLAANEVPPRGGAIVVVADPELDGPALLAPLLALRARRAEVTAVLLDPAGFRRLHPAPEGAPVPTLAEVAEALSGQGVRVHVLRSGEGFAPGLAAPWTGRPRIRITLAREGAAR